jgi:periplasmic protein TonB
MVPKKTPDADLEKMRPVFFRIGLVCALAFVWFVMEWETQTPETPAQWSRNLDELIPEEIIPVTKQEEQPKLPSPPVIIQVVKDETVIEQEAVIIESEIHPDDIVEITPVKEDQVQEPEIFYHVEEMPRFPGGDSNLFSYLAQNIRYPGTALEAGIHGVVMLSFVVGREGEITQVQVMKGIGGGCDEEAIRVVQGMPKWNPGKQRGKPVPVRYSIPVRFTLR